MMEHDANVVPLSYGSDPAILVFADSIAARARAETAVRAAGGRVAAVLPLNEALARLDRQAGLDGLMIELEEDSGTGVVLDGLLDRVDTLARAGGCTSVIAMPVALIDQVAARVAHNGIQLLCAPDPIERAAALGVILAERRARLHDVASETETRRLHELSEEVGRIARTLASLSAEVLESSGSVGDRKSGYRAEPGAAQPLRSDAIRNVIRLRRLRDRFFKVDLFADPAWDMLLDLMAARIERTQVAVSSLCIAAAVPPTTALRWIRTMTENGLFIRHADPADGRRVFIVLSDEAAAGMSNYFAAMHQIGGVAV